MKCEAASASPRLKPRPERLTEKCEALFAKSSPIYQRYGRSLDERNAKAG